MDPKKKFFLFKQSDHFCSVPWHHVQVFTNGDVKTCGKGKTVGNLSQYDLSDLVQTEWIKSIKQTSLVDQPHTNCKSCYDLSQDRQHTHVRNLYNSLFQHTDVDYDNIESFELYGIDLHWDNTCNLKCIYCDAQQSSAIAKEQNIKIQRPPPDQIDKIINLILKNQYNFKEIYFSGGEPLLSKHNIKLLQNLENTDIPIRINSNITQVNHNQEFFKQIKRFKNVLWTVSVEATESRFEYIRHGSKWQQFLENLDILSSIGHDIRINSVWFVGSMYHVFETINFFIENYKITDVVLNQIDDHPALRARNASDQIKKHARNGLETLLTNKKIVPASNSYYNIVRCRRELDLPIEDSQGYKTYFDSLDTLRGTNWRKIFPELNY